MAKKRNDSPFVYSTNPDFFDSRETDNNPGKAKNQMKPRVSLETKHRAGKAVTLIVGMEMNDSELEQITKKIKVFCGAGGSCKNGEIVIQGDHREKVLQWLLKNDYSGARKR